MKKLLLVLASLSAFAQTEFRLSQRNPDVGYQYIAGYSGSNLIYLCKAASIQPVSPAISVASATNASPTVLTVSGGHGFDVSSKPNISVSGGTGNWVAINGARTATIISSTTLSIPVDATAFGALTGTIVFTTRAPRTTSSIWSVQFFVYSGSNMIWSGWSTGVPSSTTTCTTSPTQYQ
ncbi:MAG: hypothetical protein EBR82_07185 [Caulobacteraceae bacterium]|nr:hypothetical protein [Caulobacteraceae bacterium]